MKVPYWLEHILIGLAGQLLSAAGAYFASLNYGYASVAVGLLIAGAVKWGLDHLRKVDPQAQLPANPQQPTT